MVCNPHAPEPPPMAKAKKSRSIYGVHPSVQMMADWIDSMKEKTGRTLEEWVKLAKVKGPADEEELRDWFKTQHGFGTNAAWWLAERTVGKGWRDGDPEAYLEQAQEYLREMYAGKK